MLVTGYVSAQDAPVNYLWVFPEDDLGNPWQHSPSPIPGPLVSFDRQTDGECEDFFPYHACCEEDASGCIPGAPLLSQSYGFDPCVGSITWDPAHIDCPNATGLDAACQSGPYCMGDAGQNNVYTSGVAYFGAVHDPVSDQLTLHGGVTGCVGACTNLAAIDVGAAANTAEVRVPELDENLAASSRVLVVNLGDGSIASSVDASPAAYRKDPWPVAATAGLHRTTGVSLGLEWDPGGRRWLPSAVPGSLPVLLGGTTFQWAPPATSFVTTSRATTVVGTYAVDDAYLFEWNDVIPDSDWDSLTGGTLDGADMLLTTTSTGYWSPAVTPSLPSLHGVAAVAIEPDAILLAGGKGPAPSSNGSVGLYVVDFVDLDDYGPSPLVPQRFDLSAVLPEPRYGASAVFDRVAKRAYIIGGSTASVSTVVVESANTVVDGADSEALTLQAEVSVELVPTADYAVKLWSVDAQVGSRIYHRCQAPVENAFPLAITEVDADTDTDSDADVDIDVDTFDVTAAEDCFATFLDIVLRTPKLVNDPPTEPADLTGLLVEVRKDEAEAWSVLDELEVLSVQERETTVRAHLHRTLLDRDDLQLRVSFTQSLDIQAYNEAALVASAEQDRGWKRILPGQKGVGASDTRKRVQAHVGLPASAVSPRDNDLGEVAVAHVRAPSTFTAASVGTQVPCDGPLFELVDPDLPAPAGSGDACTTSTDALTLDAWPILIGEAFERHEVVTTSGASFQVLLDGGLASRLRGPSGDIVEHWGSAQLDGDLDLLEQSLGRPFPFTGYPVVYMREPHRSCANGGKFQGATSEGAMTVLTDFHCVTGELTDDKWKLVSMHEPTHAWIGGAFTFEEDTQWLDEGLTSSLDIRRYPTVGGKPEVLRKGVEHALDLAVNQARPRFSVEVQDDLGQDGIEYRTTVYLMAQLALHAEAAGHDDIAYWGALAGMLDAAEVRAFDADAAFPGPAPTGQRLYRPTLRASDVDDAATLLGTSSWYDEQIRAGRTKDGLPLLGLHSYTPPPGASVTVRQVQQDLYGWPAYTNVPYLLGCASPDSPSSAVFSECGATQAARVPGLLASTLAALEGTRTLTQLGGAPDDVQLALYGNDLLLPGQIPAYGLSERDPWLLRCAPGSSRPDCAVDPDGDGYPTGGDCDETLDAGLPSHPGASIHPEVQTRDPAAPGYVDEVGIGDDLNCDSWPR